MTILGDARTDEFLDTDLPETSFGAVPAADPDAVIDPHWLDLRGGSTLPVVYLPPAMPGKRSLWMKVVAVVLVAMFLGATAAGVCLTYGPPLGRI
jgi:hypothetical protein